MRIRQQFAPSSCLGKFETRLATGVSFTFSLCGHRSCYGNKLWLKKWDLGLYGRIERALIFEPGN